MIMFKTYSHSLVTLFSIEKIVALLELDREEALPAEPAAEPASLPRGRGGGRGGPTRGQGRGRGRGRGTAATTTSIPANDESAFVLNKIKTSLPSIWYGVPPHCLIIIIF